MPDRLRVGVIGIGFGQAVHVPAFRAAGCEVVAIAASELARASVVARRLEIPHAFGGWTELVAAPNIDMVGIAVPPRLQPEIAIASAFAGKHLFCEKPLALDTADAARMLRAADAAGVGHAVDFEFPESQAWRNARVRCEAGEIGDLQRVVIDWRTRTRSRRADHWKSIEGEGGGLLGGFLSHAFYNFEWFAGRVERLQLFLGRQRSRRAEVVLEGAHTGAIRIDLDAEGASRHLVTLNGSAGEIVVDASLDMPGGMDSRVAPVAALIGRFVTAIRSTAPMRPGLADGLRVQELLAIARRSAELDAWQPA